MYTEYFGLNELPFSLASDPRFLYLSPDHARVKALMEYAIKVQDSFVVITGEIGTGKTTLVNDTLTRNKNKKELIRIQATQLESDEFLQVLLLEFGVEPYEYTKVQMLQALKDHFKKQVIKGKKVYLIIDEAQRLSKHALENLCHFADMEIDSVKPLSIILVGQQELNDVIDDPEMEHIRQRIRLRFHIKPLNDDEVGKYIKHRLSVAGSKKTDLFDDDCISMIQQYTCGRLRLINTLCDYTLMHCFVEKQKHATPWMIQQAANELQWEHYEKQFAEKRDDTHFDKKHLQAGASKLVINQGDRFLEEFTLSKESVSIGRHADNDIPLQDRKASRHHAQILRHGDAVYLHDLNSTNGTFVSGSKIKVHRLEDGHAFRIGDFAFTYLENDHQQPHAEQTSSDATSHDDSTRIMPKSQIVQILRDQRQGSNFDQ